MDKKIIIALLLVCMISYGYADCYADCGSATEGTGCAVGETA